MVCKLLEINYKYDIKYKGIRIEGKLKEYSLVFRLNTGLFSLISRCERKIKRLIS